MDFFDPRYWKALSRDIIDDSVIIREDIVYRIGTGTTNLDNIISQCHTSEDELPGLIAEMIEIFNEKKHDFIWWVEENDHPKTLTEILTASGFNYMFSIARFVVIPSEDFIHDNLRIPPSDVEYKNLQLDDILTDEAVNHVIRNFPHFFSDPEGYREFCIRRNERLQSQGVEEVFLGAYIDGQLVGLSKTTFSEHKDIKYVYLYTSSTDEEFRGRGIYSGMLYHRFKLAVTKGCHVVSMRANLATSGPIVEKYGFVQVNRIKVYEYTSKF